ncbi:MAG: Bax inhibitor-1/YccA family protein [Bacteroidia bacterium]
MSDYSENSWAQHTQEQFIQSGAASAFMRQVYAIMAFGLAITGLTAWYCGNYALDLLAIGKVPFWMVGGMRWIVMLSPLAFVLALSFGIQKMSYTVASLVFALYSLVNGVALSSIFIIYTGGSIASTFFVAAAMFGGMAIYGLTTKKDLTSWGSILIMGVIGLIVAGIINIFLQSSIFSFIQSVIGVVIFAGLTAYDAQKLMNYGLTADANNEGVRKYAIMGALDLYLDFINLFLYLLRLFGSRRD